MTHSLNEIEALAKRAARGGGLSWGLSEEAGKATRWLASHGLHGAESLLAYLETRQSDQTAACAPVSLDKAWKAAGDASLCPVLSGAALADCADRLGAGEAIEMQGVLYPLLILPFASIASAYLSAPLCVTWDGMRAVINDNDLHIDGSEASIGTAQAGLVRCGRAEGAGQNLMTPQTRAALSHDTYARLDAFAQRTFAPATQASRLLGAGSGVSDND